MSTYHSVGLADAPPVTPVPLPTATARSGGGGGAITTILKGIGVLSLPLLAYHGYKRNNSVGWAIAWALGSIVWPVTLPIAFAQGFAKTRVTPNKRRGRRRNR
jgi:hypothetical protein